MEYDGGLFGSSAKVPQIVLGRYFSWNRLIESNQINVLKWCIERLGASAHGFNNFVNARLAVNGRSHFDK